MKSLKIKKKSLNRLANDHTINLYYYVSHVICLILSLHCQNLGTTCDIIQIYLEHLQTLKNSKYIFKNDIYTLFENFYLNLVNNIKN